MNASTHSCALAVFVLLVPPIGAADAQPATALYRRADDLQRTLLDARQRCAAWWTEQPAARAAVTFDRWWTTPALPTGDADRWIRPRDGCDLRAKRDDGQPLWTERKAWADGKPVVFLSGPNNAVAFLTRAARAARPVRLTVGIGGGEQLEVWLNGRKVASANTHVNAGRYGCSERVDGTRVDQTLVDLDLRTGQNTLLLKLALGGEPSFYFSAAPDPTPWLWAQIRRDFPAAWNPLLDAVHADWFASRGWFAARDVAWEDRALAQLAADCGGQRTMIEAERARLHETRIDRDDPRWLDLCVKAATLAQLRRECAQLRAAVTDLGKSHADQYPVAAASEQLDAFERELTELAAGRLDPADKATRRLMNQTPALRRRVLVDWNPLLRDARILFVKRHTYNSKHYYDDFQHISRWGGNLCVLSLADGAVRELVPQLKEGVFDRYDLSFDGRRIVFGYRRPQPEGYRLWEVGADGGGLRQVTHPPADEEQRIAAYGATSTGDSFYGLLGYHFWTDDVHPCYLPDGDICFASTRCEHGVLCTPNHYLACTNLFRRNAASGQLRPLSQGALSEFTPTMLEDGRILYNRWEYVHKGIAAVQPLWITRPDGSGGEEFYGDNIANPGVFWQARQVPGHPRLVVCVGCGHEPLGVGQVLLLNLDKEKRTPAPMTSLTPHVRTENLRGLYQLRNGVWREDIYGPFYADPYPLSDKFFLVSCNPDRRYNDQAAYGIHLLDVFGNRVPIYHDAEISCWQPTLLRPRQAPPVLPAATTASPRGQDQEKATLFLSDVYRGLDGVPAGTIKYLRVLEQVPKPWSAEVDQCRGEDRGADGFGGHLAISWNSHIWVAVLHGVVPVAADGSCMFEAPARRNLFFQALDARYMAVQRMRTFINLEPGERRSCIGCHEHRTQAPVSRVAVAFGQAPASLAAQPGEAAPRPLYYPTDVQPVFDRHCVRCHGGHDPKATPDLRGEPTAIFNRSYENILQANLVDRLQEWNGGTYAMRNAETVPPYTHGSHKSRLLEFARPTHYDVKLTEEERIALVTWMDCGAPYYGSYFGRRNLAYAGQPDFRPTPTLASACGVSPEPPTLAPLESVPARLQAWWPLDAPPSATVADASGHDHVAKVLGATPCDGPHGRGAFRVDGKSYLEGGGLGAHETVSIALWVKPDSLPNQWNPLLFCHDGKPGAVHFSLLPDGTPNVAVNKGDWNWTHRAAKTTLADGRWHHLVLVCDGRFGGSVRFYVDGRLDQQQRLGLGQRFDLYGFRIGAWNRWEGDANSNFHGGISDVRIFSGMLTDEEAARLAAAPSTGEK